MNWFQRLNNLTTFEAVLDLELKWTEKKKLLREKILLTLQECLKDAYLFTKSNLIFCLL